MNCGNFRYLIQRRFDVELSPSDDRALLIHLEACESCQKFYHQVQQVIIAAEELELTDDLLPQNPQQLFNSVLENIPQEKREVKELVMSFLERFGLVRQNNDANKSGLISSLSGINISKKLSFEKISSPAGDQFEEHVITNWGQESIQQSAPQRIESASTFRSTPVPAPAQRVEQNLPQTQPAEEQIITRSLGQKFGISGANSVLNSNQPLTLAESIRQKISEMSKTGGDHESSLDTSGSELSGQEPLDEWSIPHSPQWPKLTPDIPPEQWANKAAGAKAPNTWGASIPVWGAIGQGSESLTSGESVSNNEPETVPQRGTAPVAKIEESVKQTGWSAEAEQMETGTWQTVQFDTTLGATGIMPPAQALPPVSQPTFPITPSLPIPASQDIFIQTPATIDQSSYKPNLAVPANSSGLEQANANTQPNITEIPETEEQKIQSFLPATQGGPKIYPVVSRRARMSPPHSKPITEETNITVAPQIAPPVVFAAPEAAAPTDIVLPALAPTTPAIAPVPSAYKAPTIPQPPANKLPAVDPLVVESLVKEVVEPLPAKTAEMKISKEQITPKQELKTEEDTSRLFHFDDGAIDQIFSNNLGVHERSVSTQSSVLSTPAPDNTIIADPPSAVPGLLPAETSLSSFAPVQNQSISIPPVATPPVSPAAPETDQTTSISAPSAPALPAASAEEQSKVSSAPVTEDDKSNSLFAVDDSMIDRIFTDHLGVPEQVSKNAVKPSRIDIAGESLNLPNPVQAIPPVLPVQALPETKQPVEAKEQMPQFAGSSGFSSGKQKIAGVGRLDKRVETPGDPGSGRIASIGKFLLDNKDLEKIGRITASDLSEGKMRTLTLEANEELKNLLKQIDAQQGVLGTVIVGHDGLLIAHTMLQDADAESLGVEALAIYMGTLQVVEKLGDDNVRQIVSQTNQGYLIVANFGAGLLVTLTNPIKLDGLLPLMRTITQLVAA